jgi:hypothetical protein
VEWEGQDRASYQEWFEDEYSELETAFTETDPRGM